MDDLVEAKVSVQVLLPYSVMLSEEPFDARAEMVDRAEPGFLFRYLRVQSYFLRYFQRSLIAVQRVMGDRAALVYYSVPRLSQLYSAWMPAADVLQDRFPCFVRPYRYGFLLAGYPRGASSFPGPFRTKCGKSRRSGRKGPKGQAFSAFSAASGEGFSGSSLPCSCLRLPLWGNPGRSCLGQGNLRTR